MDLRPLPGGPAQHHGDPGPLHASRRARMLAGGERVLLDALAGKVLHGWLQNRHQTLFPLTVNLRSLTPVQTEALTQWMAVAISATPIDEAGSRRAARGWFGSVGADGGVLEALERAMDDPEPLHQAIAGVLRHGLAAYAYIVALIAADPRDPASPAFLDYVAARLALPTAVVRSATRRYRR